MKRRLLILSLLFIFAGSMQVFAAAKAIPNVALSITHEIEPGDSLNEAEDKVEINVDRDYCGVDSLVLSTSGSKRTVGVGDTLKAKITVMAADGSGYVFNGTYTKSNVKVKGMASFESCSVRNGMLTVTVTLTPVSGQLDAPGDAYWKSSGSKNSGPGASEKVTAVNKANIGKAVWTAPSNSTGYYEVYLLRGGKVVHKYTEVKGTSLDCYPYMTKSGSYSFRVRTIPVTEAAKKYAQRSEWTESEEFYLDSAYVSDGTGQEIGSQTQAGWIQSGSTWYYRYPDGSLKKNGWEIVGGKWYLFDKEGKMLTGKQVTGSGTYFLNQSGDMATGWIFTENTWYYFNPDPNKGVEGAMVTQQFITQPDGKTYYLLPTGAMATGWQQIGADWYYFDQSGSMARNTVIDTFKINEQGIWVR